MTTPLDLTALEAAAKIRPAPEVIATFLRCCGNTAIGFKSYSYFTEEEKAKFTGWAGELIDYLGHYGYRIERLPAPNSEGR